jgi:hypothetical protein
MIPIYIFDEHNEAFYFWHKAKYEGYINEPLDLFHFDAHSDIGRVDKFKKPLYFSGNEKGDYLGYYRDFARNELAISNFITPAVLSGIVRDVYFIYPKWRKFKTVRKKLNISSVFGEGRNLKYGLIINERTNPKVFRAYPDLRRFNYYGRRLEKIPKNRKAILDIDLDYFACTDSISNNMSYDLEVSEEQFKEKNSFLSDKKLPYSGFDFSFMEKNDKYYVRITHKKIKDVSHLPPKEEVESEINNLIDTLKIRKIKPRIITVCRSCHSGYCPAGYRAFIETALKKRLESL